VHALGIIHQTELKPAHMIARIMPTMLESLNVFLAEVQETALPGEEITVANINKSPLDTCHATCASMVDESQI